MDFHPTFIDLETMYLMAAVDHFLEEIGQIGLSEIIDIMESSGRRRCCQFFIDLGQRAETFFRKQGDADEFVGDLVGSKVMADASRLIVAFGTDDALATRWSIGGLNQIEFFAIALALTIGAIGNNGKCHARI